MATFSYDYSFTPATAAKASEVNSNFNKVKTFAEAVSTGASLDNGAITESKILNGSVTTDKIAVSAVTSEKILDGTIALVDLATAVINKLVPSGTISPYVGSASPTGWLICDGSTVSNGQTTYPDLWAVLPATYKSGSNIVLPNLKGRTVVGLDSAQTEFDAIGETGGAKTHTLTSAEMPSHSHTINGEIVQAQSINDITINVIDGAGTGLGAYTESTASTGGGGAHNNLQPYITFNYIIKV